MTKNSYDIIIIGAGHAGAEAALAAARLNMQTLLLTMDEKSVAYLACNPSIGGTAKGQIVREIDALGGQMGKNADASMLQMRMLNRGKGASVHSPRAQVDKHAYHRNMLAVLKQQKNLDIKIGQVKEILTKDRAIVGVEVLSGKQTEVYSCSCCIVACGVYLNSDIITGNSRKHSGPSGFSPSQYLSQSLVKLGLTLRRFKTGTPARVAKDSIDFSELEVQPDEPDCTGFSNFGVAERQGIPCHLTYTNQTTHDIIRDNIHLAPMYSGGINGVGARYCPSIEDKIVRFADKPRHQIFLEPESADCNEIYVQGMSTSLPQHVQDLMYRSVKGLENCVILRYAYAIEYDCINSDQLDLSLEHKDIKGLFFAGQINGTSGYEEAAAQGLMAGINAARKIKNLSPLILERSQAYIGVLIDDLVTKGTDEPYRMMTSRAEYRLHLRQDNADTRLCQIGRDIGLLGDGDYKAYCDKVEKIQQINQSLNTHLPPNDQLKALFELRGENLSPNGLTVRDALKRPNISFADLQQHLGLFTDCYQAAGEQVEINVKYQGYLDRQEIQIRQAKKLECKILPSDIDYLNMDGLRLEARQKLNKIRPQNLGQASRISGVSPSDINILIVYLSRKR